MGATLRSYTSWLVGLLFCALVAFVYYPYINPYYQTIFMVAVINISLAVSLTLTNGYTGQFSLGHAGFMAVGGYASAALTYYLFPYMGWNEAPIAHIAFLGALLTGGLLAALCGYLVGLPSLRLKGDYLAVVTLGFGEIIRVILLNVDKLGGARGLSGITPYTNQIWVTFFALIVVFCVLRYRNTAPGRAMLAVREDEVAAEAMGVNTTRVKVKAFVMSSFFAGICGGLYGHYYGYLNPSTFSFMKSFEIVVIIVLGGLGSVSGAIFAAILLSILPEALRPLQDYTKMDFRMIIYSLILILFMIFRPNGIMGRNELSFYFAKWFKRSRA